MFHRSKVIAALDAKSGRLAGYEVALLDALAVYEKSLIELAGLSKAEIEARLKDVPWPGARPTVEHDQHPGVVVPFGHTWTNHQQARSWAKKVLSGVPTVAVDGSQITPTKDISVPVGAVQIGWFANPHDGDQGYVKDIYFRSWLPASCPKKTKRSPVFPTGALMLGVSSWSVKSWSR